jgi:hypothetical protein
MAKVEWKIDFPTLAAAPFFVHSLTEIPASTAPAVACQQEFERSDASVFSPIRRGPVGKEHGPGRRLPREEKVADSASKNCAAAPLPSQGKTVAISPQNYTDRRAIAIGFCKGKRLL